MCLDGKSIEIPHRNASVRQLNSIKISPRNRITYKVNERDMKATVSGVEFDRDMRNIFGGPDGIRTMIFPTMVRTVRQGSFCQTRSLRIIILNEGLEVLGTDEC